MRSLLTKLHFSVSVVAGGLSVRSQVSSAGSGNLQDGNPNTCETLMTSTQRYYRNVLDMTLNGLTSWNSVNISGLFEWFGPTFLDNGHVKKRSTVCSTLLALCEGHSPVTGACHSRRSRNTKLWSCHCFPERSVKNSLITGGSGRFTWRLGDIPLKPHQLRPRVTGLCEGNPPVAGGFPSQRASNAENVSIWWRHHDSCSYSVWNSSQKAPLCRAMNTVNPLI